MNRFLLYYPRLLSEVLEGGIREDMRGYFIINPLPFNFILRACPPLWISNRPFPSCLLPLFQTESKCEIFHMKMSMICIRMDLWVKLIFIWKVSHLDSFWNRGKRELGNGLLFNCPSPNHHAFVRFEIKNTWPIGRDWGKRRCLEFF